MFFSLSTTIGKVYSLLGAKNAREKNDAMPTLPVDEFLEQFIPRFGNSFVEGYDSTPDHVSICLTRLHNELTLRRETQ
jgi:hypothetical protein